MSPGDLLPSVAGTFFCSGQLAAPDAGTLVRLLLLAPLLEEWVVRGGLQEWLIRRAPPKATGVAGFMPVPMPVLWSAGAFGLLHLGAGWHAALLVLAPGLALAMLYQRTRDWRSCALLHCGFNALAIAGCAP